MFSIKSKYSILIIFILLENLQDVLGDLDLDVRSAVAQLSHLDFNKLLGSHSSTKQHDSDVDAPADVLISKYGYPVENHTVVTQDGYILTLFRIPWGKNLTTRTTSFHYPVLLMPGLFNSADDWLVLPQDQVLPYMLANEGFDVWLGNFRGGTYSRQHKIWRTTDLNFWKFSFDEMGYYDIPAMIDYILKCSGHPQLDFIGFSMGTSAFFVAMSTRPEYNQKVNKMVALAPAIYLQNVTVFGYAKYIPDNLILATCDLLFNGEFMDFKGSARHMLSGVNTLFGHRLLYDAILKIIFRQNEQQENPVTIERVVGHSPSPMSARTLVHFLQMLRHPSFRRFDYGMKENLKIYGTEYPPTYKLNNVTVPVFALYGLNDQLVRPQDTLKGLRELGNCVNIDTAAVKNPHWGHADFIFGKDAKTLVFDRLLKFLLDF